MFNIRSTENKQQGSTDEQKNRQKGVCGKRVCMYALLNPLATCVALHKTSCREDCAFDNPTCM